MARRGLDREVVERVATAPEQVVEERGGRRCYQSRVAFADGRFLVRVVVAERRDSVLVVTVYRTSNITKYWKQP